MSDYVYLLPVLVALVGVLAWLVRPRRSEPVQIADPPPPDIEPTVKDAARADERAEQLEQNLASETLADAAERQAQRWRR